MNIELLKEKQKKIENIIKKIKTNIILNDMTKINYKGLKKIDDLNYKYDNIEFTIVDGTLHITKDRGRESGFMWLLELEILSKFIEVNIENIDSLDDYEINKKNIQLDQTLEKLENAYNTIEWKYIYYWNCDTDEGDRFEFDNINNVFEYVVKYNIKQFLNQRGINVQRTTI